MGNMRLTLIVHSADGDTAGDQQAIMRTVELPDSVEDDSTAFRLIQALSQHVDDELKYMEETEESK